MPEARTAQEVFRHRLAQVRKALGYTSQTRFAERVAEAGVGLSETALARIESGKRNVRLDEALGIAAALDVSPLALFLPTEGNVRLADGIIVDADTARRWVLGEEPLDPDNERGYRYLSPKPVLELDTTRPSGSGALDQMTADDVRELLRTLKNVTERSVQVLEDREG